MHGGRGEVVSCRLGHDGGIQRWGGARAESGVRGSRLHRWHPPWQGRPHRPAKAAAALAAVAVTLKFKGATPGFDPRSDSPNVAAGKGRARGEGKRKYSQKKEEHARWRGCRKPKTNGRGVYWQGLLSVSSTQSTRREPGRGRTSPTKQAEHVRAGACQPRPRALDPAGPQRCQ